MKPKVEQPYDYSDRQRIEIAIAVLEQTGKYFGLEEVAAVAGVPYQTLCDLVERVRQGGCIKAPQRIENAITALAQTGKHFSLEEVAAVAVVSCTTLRKYPDLVEKARQASGGNARRRIENAIETLVKADKPFRLKQVVHTADISYQTLHNHPDLLNKAKEAVCASIRRNAESAIDKLVQAGKPFSVTRVADTTGVSYWILCKHTDLVERARQANAALDKK